jgi:hypothetical protein
MEIGSVSSKTVRYVILVEFLLLVVLPNVLVRVIEPGLIRPVFFAAAQATILGNVIFGLFGEGRRLYRDVQYRRTKNKFTQYAILAAVSVILIPILLLSVVKGTGDLVDYWLYGAPVRQLTATIIRREGFTPVFFIADDLRTADGRLLTFYYPDLPAIGGTYTFTLMPTEDTILFYRPVK